MYAALFWATMEGIYLSSGYRGQLTIRNCVHALEGTGQAAELAEFFLLLTSFGEPGVQSLQAKVGR